MPNIRKGEEKNSFISRCIRQNIKEGKTQDQAAGKCYGMWRQHKRKGIAKAVKS